MRKHETENQPPPDIAAALRSFIAAFHQAADAVKRWQYKTMDDALEVITGSRPAKVDHVGEVIPGSSLHEDMGLDDDKG